MSSWPSPASRTLDGQALTPAGSAGNLLGWFRVKTCACCCMRAYVPVAAAVLLAIHRRCPVTSFSYVYLLLHSLLSLRPVDQPCRMLEPSLVVRRSTVPEAPGWARLTDVATVSTRPPPLPGRRLRSGATTGSPRSRPRSGPGARRGPPRRPRPANSMRTTASRSARESKVHAMSTGVARPALPRPEPRHLDGSTSGYPRRNHSPNVERVGSLSITNAAPPRRSTRASSAQAGLAARAEEVGPARVHDVDGRVGQRESACAVPSSTRDVREPAYPPPGDRDEVAGCGSTPITDAAVAAKSGRWKPVPQPRSRTSRPAHDAAPRIAAHDDAGAVDGAVLDLVDRGVVPDVRAGDRTPGRGRPGRSPEIRCGRDRWASGTGPPRCRGCRWGRPSRP